MVKFKNKYRIESHRRPGWDYSANGFYFITVVTQNMKCIFGNVNRNNEMELSDFGKIANDEFFKSFKIRDELILHEFILMPNHFHAIIEIDLGKCNARDLATTNSYASNIDAANSHSDDIAADTADASTDARPCISASATSSPAFRRQPKSISSFLAGCKSATINLIDDLIDEQKSPILKYNRKNKLWQANYHDHIIRDKQSFEYIAFYIRNNPKKWNADKFWSE